MQRMLKRQELTETYQYKHESSRILMCKILNFKLSEHNLHKSRNFTLNLVSRAIIDAIDQMALEVKGKDNDHVQYFNQSQSIRFFL